jgi:hypothetical protein
MSLLQDIPLQPAAHLLMPRMQLPLPQRQLLLLLAHGGWPGSKQLAACCCIDCNRATPPGCCSTGSVCFCIADGLLRLLLLQLPLLVRPGKPAWRLLVQL